MKHASLFLLVLAVVACQPGPKGLAGTYRIRITPDLEKNFTDADKLVAETWKTDKVRAEEMAITHPRKVIASQQIVIGADNRYRYSGSDGEVENVIEGTVTVAGDKVTLTPETRNGTPAVEMGLQPQTYTFDLEAQTLTIDVENAPLIWEK